MKSFRSALIVTVCFSTLLSISCGAPSPSVVRGVPPDQTELLEQRVFMGNRSIAQKIDLGGIREWSDAAGRLCGAVMLVNNTARDVGVDYLFLWLGPDGVELPEGAGGWTPVIVYSYSNREVTGTAPPTGAAASFRLSVRESN